MSTESAQLSFFILEGPAAGRRIPVTGTTLVIGRDPKCSLPIDDDSLALRHCAVEALPDRPGAVVTDLMTGGQTRVNQKPIVQHVMRPGDRLQLGATTVLELQSKRSGSRPPSGIIDRRRSTRMLRETSVTAELTTRLSVDDAVTDVQRLAAEAELDEARTEQFGTAVREVAYNAIVHAGGGQLTARRTRRGIRVEVWDTGPGIPMETLKKVTADSTGEGSDISSGIRLARQIVDQLSVISLPGNTQIIMELHV